MKSNDSVLKPSFYLVEDNFFDEKFKEKLL